MIGKDRQDEEGKQCRCALLANFFDIPNQKKTRGRAAPDPRLYFVFIDSFALFLALVPGLEETVWSCSSFRRLPRIRSGVFS
jgi:hypothetical protein